MPGRTGDRAESWVGSALLIVMIGVGLGLAYNVLGLRSSPSFGLAWIGKDPLKGVVPLEVDEDRGTADSLERAPNVDGDTVTTTDDPLAAMLGQQVANEENTGLPDIPALDRPIQMQITVAKRFFDADAALFVDAREADEFAAGHIPGAVHVPFDTAVTDPELLASLPTGGRPVVVYCGGGSCEVSVNLAWELIGAGHSRVTYFQGGFPEWTTSGYPVETGEAEERQG